MNDQEQPGVPRDQVDLPRTGQITVRSDRQIPIRHEECGNIGMRVVTTLNVEFEELPEAVTTIPGDLADHPELRQVKSVSPAAHVELVCDVCTIGQDRATCGELNPEETFACSFPQHHDGRHSWDTSDVEEPAGSPSG